MCVEYSRPRVRLSPDAALSGEKPALNDITVNPAWINSKLAEKKKFLKESDINFLYPDIEESELTALARMWIYLDHLNEKFQYCGIDPVATTQHIRNSERYREKINEYTIDALRDVSCVSGDTLNFYKKLVRSKGDNVHLNLRMNEAKAKTRLLVTSRISQMILDKLVENSKKNKMRLSNFITHTLAYDDTVKKKIIIDE